MVSLGEATPSSVLSSAPTGTTALTNAVSITSALSAASGTGTVAYAKPDSKSDVEDEVLEEEWVGGGRGGVGRRVGVWLCEEGGALAVLSWDIALGRTGSTRTLRPSLRPRLHLLLL